MMGPSHRSRRTRKSSSSRRKIIFKNSKTNQESSTLVSPGNLSKAGDSKDTENADGMCPDNACSTPKAERYRIPEIKTCPPAPKKRRTSSTNCSLSRTSSTSYFAHPDIEIFFNFALFGIPV